MGNVNKVLQAPILVSTTHAVFYKVAHVINAEALAKKVNVSLTWQ
jgi:hypothetical protein